MWSSGNVLSFLGPIPTSSNNPKNRCLYWLARAEYNLLQSLTTYSWLKIYSTRWQRSFLRKVPLGSKRSIVVIAFSSAPWSKSGCHPLPLLRFQLRPISPTANCFCPEPIPPQSLLDVSDSAVQVDLPQRDAMDEGVSLMTDSSSVDNIERAVSEARKQLEQSQQQLRSTQPAEAALHFQVSSLTAEEEHLCSRLQDFSDTHNNFMTLSMTQLEMIGSLHSQLTTKSSNSEPVLCLLRQLLLTLPSDFDDDLTPDDTLYPFLCCAPDADTPKLSGRANLLLKCLHPDKSPTPEDPLVQAAGRLVKFVTLIERTLATPALRQVYDHCGVEGLRRLLRNTLRWLRCTLSAPDGFPTPQGRLAYPQLELLLSNGT